MKTSRMLLLVLLATSVCAQAQFGKLGDLAKKATKKPNTNITRANAGTWEATADIKNINAGETKDVTITVHNRDAHDFTAGDNQEGCLTVADVKAVSDTEIKLKVTADSAAHDGNCRIELTNKSDEKIYANLMVKHKPQVGENFKPEEVSLAQAFAPKWTLTLPGGGTEVLTRGKQTPNGGYEYKDTKGKWYESMYMSTMLMLSGAYGNNCSYQAMLNSKGEGVFMPMSNACGYAIGARIAGSSK